VPYRGKMNEPGYVPHVAEFIATLKDVPLREVADRTTENFFKLFREPACMNSAASSSPGLLAACAGSPCADPPRRRPV
jgi:hypothetical protein